MYITCQLVRVVHTAPLVYQQSPQFRRRIPRPSASDASAAFHTTPDLSRANLHRAIPERSEAWGDTSQNQLCSLCAVASHLSSSPRAREAKVGANTNAARGPDRRALGTETLKPGNRVLGCEDVRTCRSWAAMLSMLRGPRHQGTRYIARGATRLVLRLATAHFAFRCDG